MYISFLLRGYQPTAHFEKRLFWKNPTRFSVTIKKNQNIQNNKGHPDYQFNFYFIFKNALVERDWCNFKKNTKSISSYKENEKVYLKCLKV